MVSSYVETELHIRVAIHLSVRMSRGSSEQLATHETLTMDNEDLADLVGVPLGATHFSPLR
jgi:hypothetical protein